MEEFGRYVLDADTKKKVLVEYVIDELHYVLCECGKHAIYHWDIGTYYYECECGWKSPCGIKYPKSFIEAYRIEKVIRKSLNVVIQY